MVSKEDITCVLLSNSDESDSETVPQSHSLDEPGRQQQQQVKKRNKALQVHFKDICDAQNERRGRRSRSISCKVTHRKYMTMPARRSIPNVTKSTGVQTSPDLTKHYKTFPFERKRGHTFKHAALVEDYKGQNNGFLSDIKAPEDSMGTTGKPSGGKGKIVGQTKALLHHTDDSSGTEDLLSFANCVDGPSCSDSSRLPDEAERRPTSPAPKGEAEHQVCGARTAPKGLPAGETGSSAKRQLANSDDVSQDTRSKGMGKGGGWSRGRVGGGPVAWNSLTRVQSLGSPASACCKRKKASPLNGQQSQTLPHSAKCSVETQGRCRTRHMSASSKVPQTGGDGQGFSLGMSGGPGLGASQQIMSSPPGDKDIKVQLQAMESLVTSSQETIKVLLGVIQELEKGEAHREGLSYRTGQDTSNCDTCRNSACIIYSVELDFKQQEDKLQPLIKRLCPQEGPQCPALPYPNEVFTSTPKRKNKTESKKHARWKLWFL